MRIVQVLGLDLAAFPARPATAAVGAVPQLGKVMIVIFENTDYQKALAQPFFARLANEGAVATKFYAEVHPSQGNYIALIAGDNYGVQSDSPVNLNYRH